ncbi:MAG: FAD-dependent oxidoreductase [Hyphomicrobiales bacterium]|nr:FAD-dependent oxidoreductase [Hyphomicrobiales bacterium]
MGTYVTDIHGEEFTLGQKRRPRLPLGKITECARDVPIMHDVDVLVVGGGPAGTTAAISAARLGARVMLAERYTHLGGLSTGGLVIWIDRMTDWDGKLVIQGLGQELLDRLPADAKYGPAPSSWGSREIDAVARWKPRFSAHHDTVTWAPMIDPEQLKAVSLAAAREAGVNLLFHVWASSAIIEEGRLRGVVFESKAGRFAVTARVVIDTTGDGDIFASAGEVAANDVEASSIQQCINTSWLWAGVDCSRWLSFRSSHEYEAFAAEARRQLGLFEWPIASWRNDIVVFMGPRWAGYNGLDPHDLTDVELRSRDKMAELLVYYRAHAPGFENAWVMLTASQVGVRLTRRLLGAQILTRDAWSTGHIHDSEIGDSPSLAPKWDSVSVPFGSLLPRQTPGLIVAGRHLSCDASSQTFMREIPQCWMTGHAAGAAAALAADGGFSPQDVPIKSLQDALLKQGAYVRSNRKTTDVQRVSSEVF